MVKAGMSSPQPNLADASPPALAARNPSLLAWRDLVLNLVSKEIKVRYMGTALGFLWSLGNPLLVTLTYFIVFTFIFPSHQDRFVLHLATGMLHWTLFSQIALMGCEWFTGSSSLLKKIWFPRMIVPVSGILGILAFWTAALLVYAVLYLPLGGRPSAALLAYPLVLVFYIAFAFGFGLVACVIHALFRDLRHLLEVVLPLLFWATPIIWAPSTLPVGVQPVMALNPLYPFFIAFSNILHDGAWPDSMDLLRCVLSGIVMMTIGLIVFRRNADRAVERV
jgi:lipopolysaccharide transport system permease protein